MFMLPRPEYYTLYDVETTKWDRLRAAEAIQKSTSARAQLLEVKSGGFLYLRNNLGEAANMF